MRYFTVRLKRGLLRNIVKLALRPVRRTARVVTRIICWFFCKDRESSPREYICIIYVIKYGEVKLYPIHCLIIFDYGHDHRLQAEFEDTKEVIKIRKSKKDRQHNDQMTKDKRTNKTLLRILEQHELS